MLFRNGAESERREAMACEKCDAWRLARMDNLGYLTWHAEADELMAAGVRNRFCRSCKRYGFVDERLVQEGRDGEA